MSAQCNRFVQNAWKKELCSNCFKLREEHAAADELLKLNVIKASSNLRTESLKVQSILRAKTGALQRSNRKKNVAFPELLTEVIGYGGDDFFSDDDGDAEHGIADSLGVEEDAIPDSEEERALSNLTRANTNFNTVTANLTEIIAANEINNGKSSATNAKPLAPLMLGRMRKDAEGKKTTLLVSVTPFGADETLPTAKRPADRKIAVNGFAATTTTASANNKANAQDSKAETALRTVKKINVEQKKEEKNREEEKSDTAKLEKIIDMPLIAPGNLISVIQRNESANVNVADGVDKNSNGSGNANATEFAKSEKKVPAIARSSTIKKTDNEKPKIAVQPFQNGVSGCNKIDYEAHRSDKFAVKNPRSCELSKKTEEESSPTENGIELTLTPLRKNSRLEREDTAEREKPTMLVRGKDVNKITVIGANEQNRQKNIARSSVDVRKVEGEANEKFTFEESRELAGVPDGKADEEEMAEPPALPRSPPPIEARLPIQGESSKRSASAVVTEPRPSFLHGAVCSDAKAKPTVSQKPTTFSAPKSSTSSAKNESPSFESTSVATKRTVNGGYVLPPPSVQNANRPVQNQGTCLAQGSTHSIRSSNKDTKADNNAEVPSTNCMATSSQAVAVDASSKDKVEQNSTRLLNSATTSVYRAFESNSKVGPVRRDSQDASAPKRSATTNENVKTPASSVAAIRNHPTDGRDVNESSTDVEEEAASNPEQTRSQNKRRMAPRPPETTDDLLSASSLFTRNPSANLKSDSPVVREKEKRERASSCSPKFRKAICEAPDPTNVVPRSPDTSPRRIISLSQDSLANNGPEIRETKKRVKSRFSLKRFLRMGSRKDADTTATGGGGGGHSSNQKMDETPSVPQSKARLEIIHPLELDGAAVEVVGNDRTAKITEDHTDSCGPKGGDATKSPRPSTSPMHSAAVRPCKPPPPPRNQSLEDWPRLDSASKPVRLPPPRSETKQQQQSTRSSDKLSSSKTASWQSASATSDSIYANLAAEDVTGEVRNALAPSKPQRTASMRDQATSQPFAKKHASSSTQNLRQDYDDGQPVDSSSPTSDSPTSNDSHGYECLSSSPECDSNLELRHGSGSHLACKRKSDSSAMENGVEFKFHHQAFVRSTSLPYCGSETESELYAPYAFYTGDELTQGAEEDQDWKNKDDELKLSRLRQRRGRSIVHRSLEDNYGAVVVANHEALAQFVEQLQVNQILQVPAALRPLKNANSRLRDFNVDASTSVFIGRRIFCSASWNEQNVTLCIAFEQAVHVLRKEFYLAPIVEFLETVPKEIAELVNSSCNNSRDMEASISVFPRLQVSTIQSFGAMMKDAHDEGSNRESSFVLLQFVNALKSLQARGIEESSKNLSNVMLCREDKDACYRLYLLQGLNVDTCDVKYEEKVSLCQCALVALQQLHLTNRLPLVRELLLREKAVTLSQVKSLLEFSLWGPADASLGGAREREVALQRWLDLERATVLHALVKSRAPLTITDEYQLLFLVRTSAKIMCEASILLDEQRDRIAASRVSS